MAQPTLTALLFADTDCVEIIPRATSRNGFHLENLGTTTIRFGYSLNSAADMRTNGHKLLAGDSFILKGSCLPERVYAAAETVDVSMTASYW